MKFRLYNLTMCPCLAAQYFMDLFDEAWLRSTALFARSCTLPHSCLPAAQQCSSCVSPRSAKTLKRLHGASLSNPSLLVEEGRDSDHSPTSKCFDLSHLLALQGVTSFSIATHLCCNYLKITYIQTCRAVNKGPPDGQLPASQSSGPHHPGAQGAWRLDREPSSPADPNRPEKLAFVRLLHVLLCVSD